jgi:neutral ceramidase
MKNYLNAQLCLRGWMLLMVAYCYSSAVVAQKQTRPSTFRASVVKVDITPADSQNLLGYGARKSTGTHDSIFHKIVVLDDGMTQFYLVSTDICLMSPSAYDAMAGKLKKLFGIDPVNFWWAVTHTHSAPEVGPPGMGTVFLGDRFKHEIDNRYTNLAEQKLIDGIREAREKLAPAKLGVGWGFSQANINRRAVNVDGKASLGLNPDGPVDRRIGLIRIDSEDGKPIALIANYAIHGTVLGPNNLLISGDAPGVAAEYVEDEIGAPVIFINGAAGNLAPIYSVYDSPKSGHLSQFRVLLGDRILEANRKIETAVKDVKLTSGAITVETPRKPGLGWPEDLGAYTRTTKEGDNLVRLPVRFLNINDDIGIWSAPLELFCEISNEVRERSSMPYTFYFGYNNGWLGYLPTDEAWPYGGYEVERVSPFTPVAGKALTEAVLNYFENQASKVASSQSVGKAQLLKGEAVNKPVAVRPERDGTLLLTAENGKGVGPKIKYMPEWRAFGWFTADDHVEWDVRGGKPATYKVFLDWSVSDKEAGKPFTFQAGNEKLEGVVQTTGSWETFKTETIGTIKLSGGKQKLVFKPKGTFEKGGALLDLRSIRLVPVR